nr:MAG TPA: minor tail protein [Caudoviricetes sp.]
MDSSVLTNAQLLQYWKIVRGQTRTSLTTIEVLSIGINVTCFEVLPTGESGFYWTDALNDVSLNGHVYTSFPDIVDGSLPSVTEEKGVSNDSVNFKVSNVNDSVRALALGGYFKNAKINMTMVLLNPFNNIPLYSQLLFSGFIDYVQASADPIQKTNEMTLYINSIYKKLDVQPPLMAANSVYQSYYPGDEAMQLLGQVNSNQIWKYKK